MRTDPIGSGKVAMQMLLSQLKRDLPEQATQTVLPARLVIRESCGARLSSRR